MASVNKALKRVLPKNKRGQTRGQRSGQTSGQTVVEYILLAAVIVSVSMGAYSFFKTRLKKPLTDIKKGFEGSSTKPAAGSGGKVEEQYYQNVEFKKDK